MNSPTAWKDSVWGGSALAALSGFVIYWLFAKLTHSEESLAGVPVGIAIGSIIYYSSDKRGGRRYQILSVVLVYAALALTYAPGLAIITFKRGITAPSCLFFVFITLVSPFIDANNGFLGDFMVIAGMCLAWTLTRPRGRI